MTDLEGQISSRRGLTLRVYRSDLGDCTNGGITSRANRLVVVGTLDLTGDNERERTPRAQRVQPLPPVCQVNQATDECPAVILVKRNMGRRVLYTLRPAAGLDRWEMMGGNYAATSDSRFGELVEGFYGAVPVHDRFEDKHA